jgi:hypothetical protein
VPRLVSGPLTAGAGKQNAVVVILLRRYACLVVVAAPGFVAAATHFLRAHNRTWAISGGKRTESVIPSRVEGLFCVAILGVKPDLLASPSFV